MVYEIYFEPKVGQWRIRITLYYLWFIGLSRVVRMRTVDGAAEPVHFDTYEEAEKYVTERGIDKAYLKRDRMGTFTTWVQGQGVHASHS